MKKYIVALLFAVLLSSSVVSAQSQTFSRDLEVGASGQDVVNLQTFLINKGFTISAIVSGSTPKGYFGQQTKIAVQKYQKENGINPTGYVGPVTRGKLNGNGGVVGGPLKILSPNGGEVLQINSNKTITWQGGNTPGLPNVSIYLVRNLSGCFNAGTRPCLAVVDPESIIAANVPNTGLYTWSVGQLFTNPGELSPAYNLTEGNYFLRICRGGERVSASCDTSDGTFTFTSGTVSNQAPIIHGLDGPIALYTGEVGTWKIRATDPQNQNLSYSVDWGDIRTPVQSGVGTSPPAYYNNIQSSSLTHSYANPGTYTITVIVRNNTGQTAETKVTVSVRNQSNSGALKIQTPNGNEVWQKGTSHLITWTAPSNIRSGSADLRLVFYVPPCPPSLHCNLPVIHNFPNYTIAKGININSNSYTWKVGDFILHENSTYHQNSSVIDGQYLFQICETGTNNCDSSDQPFTITSAVSNVSDINIVSPNGGEVLDMGKTYNVSWRLDGPIKPEYYVRILAWDSNAGGGLIGDYNLSTVGNSILWNVSGRMGKDNLWSGNRYKIRAELYDREPASFHIPTISNLPAAKLLAFDESDGFITINALRISNTTCPSGYTCSPAY